MRGIKTFLFICFILLAAFGLAMIFMPDQLAQAKMGPQDAPSSRYFGVTFIALAGATWYAFHNPKKNVAVIRANIVGFGLSGLLGLYHGVTGAETWGNALISLVMGIVLAGGLIMYSPKGEKAT